MMSLSLSLLGVILMLAACPGQAVNNPWNITFSDDSLSMTLRPFLLQLYETDGDFPEDTNVRVATAMSKFLETKLNAKYGPGREIAYINTSVVQDGRVELEENTVRRNLKRQLTRRDYLEWRMSRGATDAVEDGPNFLRGRRNLDTLVGSELEMLVEVVFDRQPAPPESDVEQTTKSIMQDLTDFVTSLAIFKDIELANVRFALRREIGEGGAGGTPSAGGGATTPTTPFPVEVTPAPTPSPDDGSPTASPVGDSSPTETPGGAGAVPTDPDGFWTPSPAPVAPVNPTAAPVDPTVAPVNPTTAPTDPPTPDPAPTNPPTPIPTVAPAGSGGDGTGGSSPTFSPAGGSSPTTAPVDSGGGSPTSSPAGGSSPTTSPVDSGGDGTSGGSPTSSPAGGSSPTTAAPVDSGGGSPTSSPAGGSSPTTAPAGSGGNGTGGGSPTSSPAGGSSPTTAPAGSGGDGTGGGSPTSSPAGGSSPISAPADSGGGSPTSSPAGGSSPTTAPAGSGGGSPTSSPAGGSSPTSAPTGGDGSGSGSGSDGSGSGGDGSGRDGSGGDGSGSGSGSDGSGSGGDGSTPGADGTTDPVPSNPRGAENDNTILIASVIGGAAFVALVGLFVARRRNRGVPESQEENYVDVQSDDAGSFDRSVQSQDAYGQDNASVYVDSVFAGLDDESNMGSPRAIRNAKSGFSLSSATTVKANNMGYDNYNNKTPKSLATVGSQSLFAFSEESEEDLEREASESDIEVSAVPASVNATGNTMISDSHVAETPVQTSGYNNNVATPPTNAAVMMGAVPAGTPGDSNNETPLMKSARPNPPSSDGNNVATGAAIAAGAVGAAVVAGAVASGSRRKNRKRQDSGLSEGSSVESLSQPTDGAFPTVAVNDGNDYPGRRHADYQTAVDGTAVYQAAAVHPLDWSYQASDAASESSLSDHLSSNGGGTPRHFVWSQKDENEQRKRMGISPLESPASQNSKSEFSRGGVSSLSGPSHVAKDVHSPASESRQLINDLVWLEKKIADVKMATGSESVGAAAIVPALEQADSLSYASKDAMVSPSSSKEDGSVDSAAEGLSQNIVCRDCYAPPGKLQIVIHSTKDGPAVHTVKPGSSLYGHLFPGDLIIAVENVDTRTYSAEQVMKMMAQKSDVQRKITVLHFEDA